jgi:hypothetical protein
MLSFTATLSLCLLYFMSVALVVTGGAEDEVMPLLYRISLYGFLSHPQINAHGHLRLPGRRVVSPTVLAVKDGKLRRTAQGCVSGLWL